MSCRPAVDEREAGGRALSGCPCRLGTNHLVTAAFHCCAFWLQAKLRGVRRDLNSLTWDAFLEVPLSGLAGAGGPAGPAMGFGEGTTGHQQARSAPGRVPPACPPSCLSANQFVDLCPARVLACPSLSDSLPSPPQEEALWLSVPVPLCVALLQCEGDCEPLAQKVSLPLALRVGL